MLSCQSDNYVRVFWSAKGLVGDEELQVVIAKFLHCPYKGKNTVRLPSTRGHRAKTSPMISPRRGRRFCAMVDMPCCCLSSPFLGHHCKNCNVARKARRPNIIPAHPATRQNPFSLTLWLYLSRIEIPNRYELSRRGRSTLALSATRCRRQTAVGDTGSGPHAVGVSDRVMSDKLRDGVTRGKWEPAP